MQEVLKKENATIEHLLITHYHLDHLGGVTYVLNMLKALDTKGSSTIWKLPRALEDTKTTDLETKVQWQVLKDKQIVEVEGAKICVEYTPGHTTDHACFMLENEKVLFSGDCVLGEGTTLFEDLYSYLTTLKKMLAMNPKMIYPGHGPVIKEPEIVINHYINHRLKRENEILNVLQRNKKNITLSEMDIVKHLYTVIIIT